MESDCSSSDSEIINPENNYKFDNFGIVMADSIEDLLYDKYNHKRHGHKSSTHVNANIIKNFSDLFKNDNKESNKISKEGKSNEKQFLYNKNSDFHKKYKSKTFKNSNLHQNIKDNNNYNGLKKGKTNNNYFENNREENKNDYSNINEDDINQIKKFKDKALQNKNNSNNNQLKVIKNKELQNKNNDINKEKNKEIKININIRDKKKNAFEFNPNNNIKLNNKVIKKLNLIRSSESNNIKNINYKKLMPEEQGIFISKIYSKIKKIKSKNIISLPKSTSCYFSKKNKLITYKKQYPLKIVMNDLYFCTKELLYTSKEEKHKKVFIRKEDSKKKENQIKKYSEETDNKKNAKESENKKYAEELGNEEEFGKKKHDENSRNKNKKIGVNNSICTEIDIIKYNNSPNILIKIIKKYSNLSSKKGTIDIKSYSAGKSKSCQKIIYINLDDKKKLSISKNKKVKRIKKIHNNRYENKNERIELPLLKNKDIIAALDNSSKNKGNCVNSVAFKRRKQFSEKIFRNLRISNKNMAKSEKNIKNKLFYLSLMKDKKNEEKKVEMKGVRKYSSKIEGNIKSNLFPQTNKEKKRKNNVIRRQNNFKYSSMNKYSNITSIEFPAIDSYFN